MPHEYHVYNFQDGPRADAAKKAMADMEADGWKIHTAAPGYSELCILWVRDVLPDGTVHVDWRMTQEESDQLFGVLRQHSDVPYIAALLTEGAIPAQVQESVSTE